MIFTSIALPAIQPQKNIDIISGNISFENQGGLTKIKIDNDLILFNKEAIVFNSLYQPDEKQKGEFYLLQHFKGWIIETPDDFFNSRSGNAYGFQG